MAKCDGRMEIFSRVVGYYRPTNEWNKGKQKEFQDRKVFNAVKKEEGGELVGAGVSKVVEGVEGKVECP